MPVYVAPHSNFRIYHAYHLFYLAKANNNFDNDCKNVQSIYQLSKKLSLFCWIVVDKNLEKLCISSQMNFEPLHWYIELTCYDV